MIKDLQEYIDAEKQRMKVAFTGSILFFIVCAIVLLTVQAPLSIFACWIPFFGLAALLERSEIQTKIDQSILREARNGFFLPIECLPGTRRKFERELLWYFARIGADIEEIDIFERKFTGDNPLWNDSFLYYVQYNR